MRRGRAATTGAATGAAPPAAAGAEAVRRRAPRLTLLQAEDALRRGQHLQVAHAPVRNLLRQGTPLHGGASITVGGSVPHRDACLLLLDL